MIKLIIILVLIGLLIVGCGSQTRSGVTYTPTDTRQSQPSAGGCSVALPLIVEGKIIENIIDRL